MAEINYIRDRERYVPEILNFDTSTPSGEADDPLFSYDTKIGELLSKYSPIFKVERVTSVTTDQLKLTRRGTKFYDVCQSKFGSNFTSNTIDNFRALVIPNYNGRRPSSNMDENVEILVFDKNGFLVANPPLSNAISMVIDGVLYIAFLHERYGDDASYDRDTTGEESYTKSKEFDVVGIAIDKDDFDKYGHVRFNSNNTSDDYDTATCLVKAGRNPTSLLCDTVGFDLSLGPVSEDAARNYRWAIADPLNDLGLFVKIDLAACADRLAADLSNARGDLNALKNIPGLEYGGQWPSTVTAVELENSIEEIIEIINDRASYNEFIEVDPVTYTTSFDSQQNPNEVWFKFVGGTSITSMGLYVVQDYKSFRTNELRKLYYKIPFLPAGSQICVQNRNKPFTCHLRVSHNQLTQKYELSSAGDESLFANYIKQLKLFHEDYGLYAIPLVSFFESNASSNNSQKGIPNLKVKEPDVMLWIDGVKMVPYVDYRIDEGANGVYGCQYIRLMQLPDTSAASSFDGEVEDVDDAAFPVPNVGKGYDITVICAYPRGNAPERRTDEFNEGSLEGTGILDRYIGPSDPLSHDVQYPITSSDRAYYPANVIMSITWTWGVLTNMAFDYSNLLMVPVGAIPEIAILAFQNGRYVPLSSRLARRMAGDRIFAFNGEYRSGQDMELHFILDTRIPMMKTVLNSLKSEEGNFDYLFRLAIDEISGAENNSSLVQTKIREIVYRITRYDWENNELPYDDKFYGFARWINTKVESQYGTLDLYIQHNRSDANDNEDIYFDANRSLDASEGLRSINVDPSRPLQTGEIHDEPDNEN